MTCCNSELSGSVISDPPSPTIVMKFTDGSARGKVLKAFSVPGSAEVRSTIGTSFTGMIVTTV